MAHKSIPFRCLGNSGITVSALGMGWMGIPSAYGPTDEAESLRVLHRYLELGGNFLDTAEVYGPHKNEELLGRFLRDVPRDSVVVATKFGFKFDDNQIRTADSSPANVRRACDGSLHRLGIDVIDLFYQHRVDPNVPIEDTVGAMAELVTAGKVRALGLSEAGPELIRRAHAVHPITALQSEYSLWERRVEGGIPATCRELGITLVPFSPLGRAALTGGLKPGDTFDSNDFRASNPRFSADNLATNLEPVAALAELAADKGCRPGQLALAWLLAQPLDVVPIPGTKRIAYVQENLAATAIAISADEVAYLSDIFAPGRIVGERYTAAHARTVAN